MATTNQPQKADLHTAGAGAARAAPEDGGRPTVARLTTEQVWHQVAKGSFAVLSHVTSAGEPGLAAWSIRRSVSGCTSRPRPTAGRPGTSRPAVGWR